MQNPMKNDTITIKLINHTAFEIRFPAMVLKNGLETIEVVKIPAGGSKDKLQTTTRILLGYSIKLYQLSAKTERKYNHFEGEFRSGNEYTVTIKGEKLPSEFALEAKDSPQILVRNLAAILSNLRKLAAQAGFLVTLRDQVDYDRGREISNSFFNWFPGAVAFPEKAEDVALCINFCKLHQVPFRTRSGGHQHEGMSSANNTLMIRMSAMNKIAYTGKDKMQAWIDVGKKLQNVYYELELEKRYLPGGGCQSVNVGGLTLGGGWGGGTREYGMTCDQVLEAEVVLANGDIVLANPKNHEELYWALRGGGGGNFGIVTRFRFQLQVLNKISTAGFSFDRSQAKKVIQVWMDALRGEGIGMPDHIIVTMNLHADYKVTRNNSDKIQVFVRCFKGKDELKAWSKLFNNAVNPKAQVKGAREVLEEHSWMSSIVEYDFDSDQVYGMTLQEHDQLTYGAMNPGAPTFSAMAPHSEGAPDWMNSKLTPPGSTCDQPHPHKVSSAFQLKGGSREQDHVLIDAILAYMEPKKDFPNVNAFLTFHALGGASAIEPEGGRAYNFGDRNYLLQFQTWWSEPRDPKGETYIQWVSNFRRAVKNDVSGAFINFVDYDLVEDPTTPAGRIELLEKYYGNERLGRLRKVKQQYDPNNTFDFQMSIPLPD